jgi:hypothetical protein
MLSRLFTTTATLRRMTKYTSNGVSKIKLVSGTSLLGYLQAGNSLDPQSTEAFGKIFTFFCSYTSDIKESDELTISSILYRVREVRVYQEGKNLHKEALLIKEL